MDQTLQRIRALQHGWHEEKSQLHQKHDHAVATAEAKLAQMTHQANELATLVAEERRVTIETLQQVCIEKMQLKQQLDEMQQRLATKSHSPPPSVSSPTSIEVIPPAVQSELQSLRGQIVMSAQTVQLLTSTLNKMQMEKEDLQVECNNLREENRRLREERMSANASSSSSLNQTANDTFHSGSAAHAALQRLSSLSGSLGRSSAAPSSLPTADHTPLARTASTSPVSARRRRGTDEGTAEFFPHAAGRFTPSTPRSHLNQMIAVQPPESAVPRSVGSSAVPGVDPSSRPPPPISVPPTAASNVGGDATPTIVVTSPNSVQSNVSPPDVQPEFHEGQTPATHVNAMEPNANGVDGDGGVSAPSTPRPGEDSKRERSPSPSHQRSPSPPADQREESATSRSPGQPMQRAESQTES